VQPRDQILAVEMGVLENDMLHLRHRFAPCILLTLRLALGCDWLRPRRQVNDMFNVWSSASNIVASDLSQEVSFYIRYDFNLDC
jgi:hypothetical protein